MKAITISMVLLAATLAGAGENDAVTFTRDVHHLRTVILEISEEDDDVDEVTC